MKIMFETKTLIPVLIVLIYCKSTVICDEINKPYEPPGNIKFPFGDEMQLNTDVSENDTNYVLCKEVLELKPEQGRCPFPPEDPGDMALTNPYVSCPEFPEITTTGNVPLGDPVLPTNVQCRNCDLKLTDNDEAVLLKCQGCFDIPMLEREANFTEKELLYMVYFIEIANYTSVDIQGRENF